MDAADTRGAGGVPSDVGPGPEPWFVAFSGPRAEGGPTFFASSLFPWVERIEREWPVIREELEALLRDHEERLSPYFEADIVTKPQGWKVYPFFYWKLPLLHNWRRCPRTVRALRSIPNVVTGAFSILDPKTTIKEHIGDTDAIARCHLGLVVPGGAPQCALRVEDEVRPWQEGRLLLFCEGTRHSAWNDCDRRRVVLFIDVIRPEYADQVGRICRIMWLAVALSLIEERLPFVRQHRRRLRRLLYPVVQMRPLGALGASLAAARRWLRQG